MTLCLETALENGDWSTCTDGHLQWLLRLNSAPPVDVVIPVHGGLADLRTLMASPCLWQDVRRVIVVDDFNPPADLTQIFSECCPDRSNFLLLRNERNLGFVRSVNRGIRASKDGDVIVLNSDTRVTRNWVRQLRRSAYSFRQVATVSPLSNAAGFFSILPPQADFDHSPGADDFYARTLAAIAPRMHERATATSGFCWYVRRDAIDAVGLLDERLFYRGYAEDTDFCLRAADAGFANLCSLQTYIYHRRSGSFGLERSPLKKANASLLKAIFPAFHATLRDYEERSSVREIADTFSHLDRDQVVKAQTGFACRVAACGTPPSGEAMLDFHKSGARFQIHWLGRTLSSDLTADDLFPFLAYVALRFGISELRDEGRCLDESLRSMLLDLSTPVQICGP